jgi:YEATS-Like-Associating Three TM
METWLIVDRGDKSMIDERVYVVVAIIIATGLLGGYGAYLLDSPGDPVIRDRAYALKRSLLLGVIASLAVPLFLSLTKSGLMGNIFWTGNPPRPPAFEDYLVFAGLCVLAAVSARRFISSVTDRLLQRVDQAEQTAAKAQQTAEQAKVEAQEGEEADEPNAPRPTEVDTIVPLGSLRGASAALSADEVSALRALTRKTYRTRTGIADDSGISKNRISEVLDDLHSKMLAMPTKSPKTGGLRWIITKAGEDAVSHA